MRLRNIGITGNIGSGKTTVCKIFENMGIAVAYADDIAKELMRSRLHIRSSLIAAFGSAAYSPEGRLDTKVIAQHIFQDDESRKMVEGLVHPAVKEYLKFWFESHANPYALEEAALIFESGSHQWLDAVIWVDAPRDLRMNRVTLRDGITEADFNKRDRAQGNPEEKMKMSDFHIVNDGNHSLIQQIADIHKKIIHS